jgi:hypothetical protein
MSTAAPDTLGPMYDKIQDEMVGVHANWESYNQLFGTEGRVKLLNRLVPSFGWIVQRVLRDAVVLGVCRLCDRGKKVTIGELVESLKIRARPEELKSLKDQMGAITKAIEPLKVHRDECIAHIGKKYVLNSSEVLPEFSRQTIREALAAMCKLMGDINDWYLKKETYYVPSMPGDGGGLIHWLQYGERLLELQDDSWCNRLNDQQVIEKLRIRMLGEPT